MIKALKNILPCRLPIFLLSLYILTVPFESILLMPTIKGISVSTVIGTFALIIFVLDIALNQRKIRIPANIFPWLTIFLWILLSAIWSVNPVSTLSVFWVCIRFMFFFAVLIIYEFTKKDIAILKKSIILSGVIAAAFVLVFYLQGNFSWVYRTTLSAGGNSTDPNHLAASLILPFALQLGRLVMSKGTKRPLDILFLLLMFFAFIATGSRGGLLSIFAVIMSMFIFFKPEGKENKAIFSVIAILAIGFYFTLPFLSEGLVERFVPTDDLNRFSAGRIEVWQAGYQAWLREPMLGYGFGNFNETISSLTGLAKVAHNIYLQFLVELGPFGLVFLLYAGISSLWFKAKTSLGISAKAALVGLGVASFSLGTFNYDYFWLIFTMVVISKNYEKSAFRIYNYGKT